MIGILGTELLELQLSGRPIFFRGIAGLTARDHIPLGTPPAACKRYNMIHGQRTGRKRSLTVCTNALGNFITPPLRGTQGPGFGFFAGDMAWIFVNFNPICHDISLDIGFQIVDEPHSGEPKLLGQLLGIHCPGQIDRRTATMPHGSSNTEAGMRNMHVMSCSSIAEYCLLHTLRAVTKTPCTCNDVPHWLALG